MTVRSLQGSMVHMEHIHLLTGNEGKVKAANLIFGKYGVEVKSLGLDIPEIQALLALRSPGPPPLKPISKPAKPSFAKTTVSSLRSSVSPDPLWLTPTKRLAPSSYWPL